MYFYDISATIPIHRSSCQEVFCKKGAHGNFPKFKRKHLRHSLFFNKVAALLKKETMAQVFSCEFCEISKNNFSYRTPSVAASVYTMILTAVSYYLLKPPSANF